MTLVGKSADIKKKLEANPKTKIPQILFTVYQHVFNSIYMLSSILNTPYPPPDLLHPMAEKIHIIAAPPPQTTEKGDTSTQPAVTPTAEQNKSVTAATTVASASVEKPATA
ncbi:MAG: hypothetical protein N3D85_05790 [Candidatus Bathyarchaeota archaeon]|nr:hypothetical protein [Candidatus Bathyarchaeota archaeon]